MAWYDLSWGFRVKVTVQNAQVPADATDFPVYVSLSGLPGGFHEHVNQTDARDIRVTKADGTTEIPREVVFYDSSLDTGELHFKGDLLGASDVDFYIYYGNAGASEPAVASTFGRDNVWTIYLAVYHFQEAVNNDVDGYVDSTGVNHGQGSSMAITAPDGKLSGKSGEFDGSVDRIILPKILFNNTWTGTVWAWADVLSASSGHPIYYQGSGSELGTEFGQYQPSADPTREALWARSGGVLLAGTIDLNYTTGVWYHLGFSADGTTPQFYFDGDAVDTFTGLGSLTGGAQPDTGGFIAAWNNLGSESHWDGKIDELRIRDDVVTDDWVKTEYNNGNSPSTFYLLGGEEEETLSFRDAPNVINRTEVQRIPDRTVGY